MPTPSHTGLLLEHLNRILYNKSHYPDRVEASIAALRLVPNASEAANELAALLGTLLSPTPIAEVVPSVPVLEPLDNTVMFFADKFAELSAKLDEIISLLKSKPEPVSTAKEVKDGGEVTSPEMAKLAAQVLNNPKSTKLNKRLAAALLTQAPNRA